MEPDERPLTAEERAALALIEDALAGNVLAEGALSRPEARPNGPAAPGDDTGVAALTLHLRAAAPQADPAYRDRLRARLLADAPTLASPPARLISRRRLLAAGFAAATVGGAALAAPPTRAALASLLGLAPAPPPTIAPIVVERAAPLPLTLAGSRPGWQGPDNAQREHYQTTIVSERWANFLRFGHPPEPPAGSVVTLPSGRPLPIPSYLPADFHWQGIALSDGGSPITIPYAYAGQGGGGSAGGGGSGLPWERPLQYDHQIAAYLIGGDQADRLLILQQLRPDPRQRVIVSAFQMDVPAQTPPRASAPPGLYGQRTVLGILVEPSRDQAGLSVQAGPGTLHPVTVGGAAGWWFPGQWDERGQWTDDGRWRTVVWPRDGFIYCLAGQDLPLDELLRVATSLP